MIGFLRLIGVLNAGIWLGGSFFFTAFASPALRSAEMAAVLQAKNFPYFSPAIEHVVLADFFQFSTVCALVALLHLCLEWIHLGRPTRKLSFALLGALLMVGLIGRNWVQPRLKTLHSIRFTLTELPAKRDSAAKSYDRWHMTSTAMDWSLVGGLLFYFGRVTKPSDTPRFTSSVKFRG